MTSPLTAVFADSYVQTIVRPQPPVAGPQGWWDADDASTFTFTTGTTVAAWRDKSGNGYHGSHTTPSFYPVRETEVINGRAAVKFVNRYFQTTLPAQTKPFTLFAAVKTGPQLSNVHLLGKSFGTGELPLGFNVDMFGGKFRLNLYTSTSLGSNTTVLTTDTALYLTITYTSVGVYTFYLNGTADGTGTSNQTFAATTMGIGGAQADVAVNSWLGYIGELLRYDRVLSAGELSSMHSYLQTKWGSTGPPLPTTIPGLQLWFDGADTASIMESTAPTRVSSWYEKSINGRNSNQGTAANQPVTGTRTLNGRNVIDFTPSQRTTTGTNTFVQPFTMVVAAAFDGSDSGTGRCVFSRGDGGVALRVNSGRWEIFAGTGVDGGPVDNNPHVFVGTFNGASSTFHIDGALVGSGDPGTAAWSAQAFSLGGGLTATDYWDGINAETLFYDRVLTTTERQTLESYLKTKWGTP